MTEQNPYRDPRLADELIRRIEELQPQPMTIMEVCGTHTMSIYKYGLKSVLPKALHLVSGPGCPVCVTTNEAIEQALLIASRDDVIFTTFGDMMRIPAPSGNFLAARSAGADVRVVFSPLDALRLAEENPLKQVVFFAVGFETTAPTTAAALLTAQKKDIKNFTVLCLHKTMPEALRALLPDSKVDALLCPGHVATVTGAAYFSFVPRQLNKPAVITGFEPLDILQAILLLLKGRGGEARLYNAYGRCVKDKGNPYALAAMAEVFEPADAYWRGLGLIKGSALALKDDFKQYDALLRFAPGEVSAADNPACRCGAVLRGELSPGDCPLMGKLCTPDQPVGACMVSSEGACAAYYKYGRK